MGSQLLALCKSPVLHAAEDFISIAETAEIVGRADDAAWLASHGVTTRRNFTGWSCELPVAGDPVIAAAARLCGFAGRARGASPAALRCVRWSR